MPKTPQYKRVAKGINHTINDKIRCMLSHAKLPKSFYGETMRIVVDFINLSPLVSLNIDVLERVCSWKNESYDFLRVFSYKAFIHVSRDERSKLDNKTKQCLFIDYEHEEFGVDFGTRSTTK